MSDKKYEVSFDELNKLCPTCHCENDEQSHQQSQEKTLGSIDEKKLKDIYSLLTQLCDFQSEIKELIEKRLAYDVTKENAFERLYNELDELKRKTAFQHIRPLFIDIILFYDRLDNIYNNASNNLYTSTEFSNIIETIIKELLEIMRRRGIEIIPSRTSVFDPSYQHAIGVESTSVEAEENQVHSIIRRGFRYMEYILRPEEVIVKKKLSNGKDKSPVYTDNEPKGIIKENE
jgi:molecular chaperone GrpE (heat shock protein)